MKIKKIGKAAFLLTVLLIGVGYAAVTTTLTSTGSTKVVPQASNFEGNIVFDSVSASATGTTTTISQPTLSTDKKTITFSTQTMTAVNDSAILSYKIKNTSVYNASIAKISCTTTDATAAEYISVTPSRGSSMTLNKGTASAAETVTFKLIKSYPESTTMTFSYTCELTATALAA